MPESADLQADERVDQLGLAVALDTGEAQDLARVDGEGDVVEQRLAARRPPGGRSSTVRTGRSVTVDSAVSGVGSSLPTISSASWRGVVSDGDGRADRRTAPDDRDLVGDREDLAQLVRDEDDRQALGLELAQVGEERVDLLRHEDGGRLVEDQGAGAAVEDLEDLHALAVGDAELLDQGVGADPEAVRGRRSP